MLVAEVGIKPEMSNKLLHDFSNWRDDRKKQGLPVPIIAVPREDDKWSVNLTNTRSMISLYAASLREELKQSLAEDQKRKDDTRSAEARRKKMELEARRRGMMQTLNNDLEEMQKE